MFVEGHIHDVIYHCAFCQAPRSVTTFHYHVTSLNEKRMLDSDLQQRQRPIIVAHLILPYSTQTGT